MKYLRDESHYQHNYDVLIVAKCRKMEEKFDKEPTQYIGFRKVTSNIKEWMVLREMASLGVMRQKVVDSRMLSDRRKDELLAFTTVPKVQCPKCGEVMKTDMKTVKEGYGESPDKVVFVLRCPSCHILKWACSDGTPSDLKEKACPKCAKMLTTVLMEQSDTAYEFLDLCPHCGYEDRETIDLAPEKGSDPEFERDRERFCLDPERAREAYEWYANLYRRIDRIMSKTDERAQKKPVYDRLSKVKRMGVKEMEKYLAEWLAKQGYSDFSLSKPEISEKRAIHVHFVVMDAWTEPDRNKSMKAFRFHLNTLLDETNWFVTSERIELRLGIFRWRIRGIDDEADLLAAVEKEMEKLKQKTRL